MQVFGPTALNFEVSANKKADSRVFRMVQMSGGRTEGSMPVWGAPETPEEKIAGTLTKAADKKAPLPPDFAATLAASEVKTSEADDDSFGFSDLVDIINPLQHIPIIGSIYREVTGDTIKPVSRIIGGAAFGGIAGAASSVANVIVEEETGKDIAGNIASALGSSEDHGTTIAVANLRARTPRYNS
jgi:hypothetical protein